MSGKILVPIDLNHEAVIQGVLQQAKEIAGVRDATIDLLTVVPDLDMGVMPYISRDQVESLTNTAQKRLEDVAREQLGNAFEWKADAVMGRIARTIIDIAEKRDADLIIMASHNPAFSDLLFGSVASQVVRHAKRSVLIVRPNAAESSEKDNHDSV
ncbi:universal stress protein [Spectribacter hydrogenoxidans]|uniref:Universal stress protein n=1 Tax=Spectribacter hydrogenoxidans TaxID=3075608 RepID=A0ABU3C3R4_9GAMM|nr:universal stress protein [Salinisphaera sp. W335]MDT0636190.1 universal stress protein [Salinisphaera sp. W335]